MSKDRETAFIVCADKQGNLSRGALATGSISDVSVLVKCSCTGQRPIAIVHNHPSGNPLPSKKDMDASRSHGNIAICVRTEGHGVRCYKPKTR